MGNVHFSEEFVWHGPSVGHQLAVRNLVNALLKHCPKNLEVLPGPLVLDQFPQNAIQPDVIVTKKKTLPNGNRVLGMPPLLIAEVVDDRSRSWDEHLKPLLYAKNHVEHYWHFDPETEEFVAYRMSKKTRKYKKVVTARGDERVGFDAPILVEICPARLMA